MGRGGGDNHPFPHQVPLDPSIGVADNIYSSPNLGYFTVKIEKHTNGISMRPFEWFKIHG